VRTIRALAGFLQNGLLGLLDDQRLETSIVDKRAPPSWVAILQQKQAKITSPINIIQNQHSAKNSNPINKDFATPSGA
jgi:hypothetical protein